MKILLLNCLCVLNPSLIYGQGCSTEFTDFVSCLETKTNATFEVLEKEYRNDLINEIERCFGKVEDFEKDGEFCFFDEKYYRTNWFNAYTYCDLCHKLSRHLMRKLILGKYKHRKCAIRAVMDGFNEEVSTCVQEKTLDEIELKIPNFDTVITHFRNRGHMLKAMNLMMSFEIVMDVCLDSNEAAWKRTQECLEFGSGDIRQHHCPIVEECAQRTSKSCPPEILKNLFQQSCVCASERRASLSKRLKTINNVLTTLANRTKDDCVIGVTILLWPNDGTDWLANLNKMMDCLPQAAKIENLIEIGCQMFVDNNKSEVLVSAFHYLSNFLNSLLDRAFRFCPCVY